MQYLNTKIFEKGRTIMIVALMLSVVLAACSPAPTPTPAPTVDPAVIQTQSAQTVVAEITAVAPPTATVVPPPGPTPEPSVPVSVVPTPEPGQPSVTANYNTVIMSGPGSNYIVYGALLGGAQAVPAGKSIDGLWWVIQVPVAVDGIGWVSASWVTVIGGDGLPVYPTPPVPPSTALVPPQAGDPQAKAVVNTFVRTGPADTYPAYGIAQAGVSARVLGKSTDGLWLAVRTNPQVVGAGYGWAAAQYLETMNIENIPVIEAGAPPVVEAPPAPAEGVPSAASTDYINVRSGPGTNYAVLVVAPPGVSGEVTGRSADDAWWQVKLSTKYSADGFGWVSKDYVISNNTESVPVVSAPPPPTIPSTPPTTSTCTLVSQNPADNTVYAPNTLFQTVWVVQNTSTETWISANYDVRFYGSSSTILHQGSDVYDVTSDVAAEQSYTVTVPMIAPSNAGTYAELWGISAGADNPAVCQFWITIQVQ